VTAGDPQQTRLGVQALLAAERLLAGTAESVNPGTPAADLLACVARYRAHLAALAAAFRQPGRTAAWPCAESNAARELGSQGVSVVVRPGSRSRVGGRAAVAGRRDAELSERTDVALREMTSESSWKCSRAFPARADQISRARAFIAGALAGCRLAEDAVLICSELCTNAVLHSDSARPGGRFTVRAEVHEGDYVWLEVEDEGGRWAEQQHCDERGRGLEIVAAIADYWEVGGDDMARVVCARLDWREDDSGQG